MVPLPRFFAKYINRARRAVLRTPPSERIKLVFACNWGESASPEMVLIATQYLRKQRVRRFFDLRSLGLKTIKPGEEPVKFARRLVRRRTHRINATRRELVAYGIEHNQKIKDADYVITFPSLERIAYEHLKAQRNRRAGVFIIRPDVPGNPVHDALNLIIEKEGIRPKVRSLL